MIGNDKSEQILFLNMSVKEPTNFARKYCLTAELIIFKYR